MLIRPAMDKTDHIHLAGLPAELPDVHRSIRIAENASLIHHRFAGIPN